ncbi:hypothetical protein [Chamaesiphon polymorphus]|uniref:Uncharacterized protein n=1 Tax=Chamaesiphon polymorphus CCALA 037 TaxID=2107692 RepID=A0A2T1GJ14_9CYAN|nr:hypothetical protein [Chamaesiphon polymorphus]PSB57758.1 hypothetical protein C7B77_07295 [Chamaesiphon polymorphus CCALA 037]
MPEPKEPSSRIYSADDPEYLALSDEEKENFISASEDVCTSFYNGDDVSNWLANHNQKIMDALIDGHSPQEHNNDENIYMYYQIFPDNIRDLRFGNYSDDNNVYRYYYRGVDEKTFHEDKKNFEPYFYIQQWVVDEVERSILASKKEEWSPLSNTGLTVADANARGTYEEIEIVVKTIGNLPQGFDNYSYMPESTYIKVNWDAVAKEISKAADGITIKIAIKPKGSVNKSSKPVGTQYITLPHVDKSKTQELEGFSFIYGREHCVYKFSFGRPITINVLNRDEGVKAINRLMKTVVDPMKRRVTEKDLVFKTLEKHSLEGIKGTFVCFVVEGEEECRGEILSSDPPQK